MAAAEMGDVSLRRGLLRGPSPFRFRNLHYRMGVMSANFKLTLVIAMVCAIVASCSTSQNVGPASVPTWNNAAARAGFSLDVSDDSYIDGGTAGGYNLSVKDYGEDIVVSVEVE